MTLKEIQDLIKLINKFELSEFTLKEADFELKIRTNKYSKEGGSTIISGAPPVMPVVQASSSALPVQEPAPAPSQEAAPAPKEEAPSQNLVEIKSPIVGTFYRSSSPDKPVYAKVGDAIEVGSVVCIVEAMKLFNEIESEVSGKIVKVMVEDASPVEYDQVLFLVDPNG